MRPVYVFKKRWLGIIMTVIDSVGGILFHYDRKDIPSDAKHLLVLRLDQMGDVVMSEPFLTRLRLRLPHARIMLLTSPVGKILLDRLPGIDEIRIFDAPWFKEHVAWWTQIKLWTTLIRLIRECEADVIMDLRGDFRHILAARIAKPGAWIASLGVTGGRFLLNTVIPYSSPTHAARRNLEFLSLWESVSSDGRTLRLDDRIASHELSDPIRQRWSHHERPRVAIHVGAGTSAKRWPLGHWTHFIRELVKGSDFDFFWIGDRKARDLAAVLESGLEREMKPRFTNLCERLSLAELGSFFRECDLLVSTDSGPVHVAAAQGLRTIVLFSGTNRPDEWRPLNENAVVLSHRVPCSPCSERRCPKPRHYCMEGLSPEVVIGAVLDIMGKGVERHA